MKVIGMVVSYCCRRNKQLSKTVPLMEALETKAPRAPALFAFDCEYYIMNNPDIRDMFMRSKDHKLDCAGAFQHWLSVGHITHGGKSIPPRDFNSDYDCLEYLHRYPDLKQYFKMSDGKHQDCTNLKVWYDYYGKPIAKHKGGYIP